MRVSHLPCSLMLNIVPGPSTELGSVRLTAKVCAFLKLLTLLLLSSRRLRMVQPAAGGCWLFCLSTLDTSCLSCPWPPSKNVWLRSSTSSHICRASPTTRASLQTNKHLLDFEVTFKKKPSATPAFVPTASSPHQLQLRDPPSPPPLVYNSISAKLSFTLTYTANHLRETFDVCNYEKWSRKKNKTATILICFIVNFQKYFLNNCRKTRTREVTAARG